MAVLHEIRRQLAGAMLCTCRPLAGARAGKIRTRVRGSGSDLDQLRDYQPGDDVRFIDWKSSARIQRVVMRDYYDEQCRTVHIVCDQSRSMDFGVGARRMRDWVTDVALTLAVLSENSGDACGLFAGRDRIFQLLSPAVGGQQTARIGSFLSASASGQNLDLSADGSLHQWCVDLCARNLRPSVIFIVSDFIGDFDARLAPYTRALARKHILVAVRIGDESERCPVLVGRRWILSDSEIADAAIGRLRLETLADCQDAARRLSDWRKEQRCELLRAGFVVCDCFCRGSIVQQMVTELRRVGLFAGRRN